MTRVAWMGLALFLACGASSAQAPPPPPAPEADVAPDALLYERDFELLLEEAGVPTEGQLELDRQIAALAPERAVLEKRAEGLRRRLRAIETTYTLEDLAEEFARQGGVHDLRTAQENLKSQIREAEEKLQALDRRERDLRARRDR